jgi:hypothetical protein
VRLQSADGTVPRLLFLLGSIPAGVAAVAIEPAAVGDGTVLALSLAATRLVLAAAHAVNTRLTDILRLRITRACLTPRRCSPSRASCRSRSAMGVERILTARRADA